MSQVSVSVTEEVHDVAGKLRDKFGLLVQDDVARLLGVSKATLRRWRADGKGPAYIKVEKSIFYRQRAVDNYFEALENNLTTGF
jgi:DNA-binding XRE family transcriptional regulator